MAATPASFKARFSEFEDEEDARIQLFLDDVTLLMSDSSRWLGFYDTVCEYYTAHFIAVSDHTATGDSSLMAPLSMQDVDDTTIKTAIADVKLSFDELGSTAYGKRVMFYRNICFGGIRGV